MKYKAISIKQPFASLIAAGKKTIETRKWKTNYRGDLIICSSKNPNIFPNGYALCIVELCDVRSMEKNDEQAACCDYYENTYSWCLRNLRKIDPIFKVTGQLNLFTLEISESDWKNKKLIYL